jgi:hypothetical protein
MRLPITLLCLGLFAISSCRLPSEPEYLIRGEVAIYADCEMPVDASGVRVEIPELGFVTTTDAQGRYSFTTSEFRQYYKAIFSKPGIYDTAAYIYPGFVDSASYKTWQVKLYQHFDFSGAIVGQPVFTKYTGYNWKDTTVIDENGVLVKGQVAVDSTDMSWYKIAAVGINELGQQTMLVRPRILVSTNPNIDALDRSTYILSLYEELLDPTVAPQMIKLPVQELHKAGLRKGDKFYLSATGVSRCAPFHIEAGTKRSDVIERVLE